MIFLLVLGYFVSAQVLAPSAQELAFSFKSTVVMDTNSPYLPTEVAHLQASFMFGIFSSPEKIKTYGLDPSMIGGIGAPKNEMNIQILSKTLKEGRVEVKYSARGTFIFQNKVANKLTKAGKLSLALPVDPLNTFDLNCTDPHYRDFQDFWYFYNPFRKGCEYLYQTPSAVPVEIKISAVASIKKDFSPRLGLVRGDNGNGSLFSIYIVHGYYESSRNPEDEGLKSFHSYNLYLKNLGFEEKNLRENTTWPLSIFKGKMNLSNGKTINIEINHALVESSSESKNIYFAKFFKQAIENGDVVIYSGHSGLGSNLDISYLESKAGKFHFPVGKRQIFFFESCSGYSYYLDLFKYSKTRATIDVVTNGLSSYFETSHNILTLFTAHMLNPQNDKVTWLKILRDLETPLEGGSYLINVGGL